VRRLTVIALGGNALVRAGETGTFAEQRAHVEESIAPIARVAAQGMPLIVTHGNGPVVGQLLLQGELARAQVPPMPLHVMDAESQGSVGFLLVEALTNHLLLQGTGRQTMAVVTRVVVDGADPSFREPTKPVGLFYTETEAAALARNRGWTMAEDSGRGYRRRVPSPRPLRILEAPLIGRLAKQGVVTIAAGGGGIPVVERPDGTMEGVDAVVDKDRASALLGVEVGAERLLILTSVDAVYTGFGGPQERRLPTLVAGEATRLLAAGEFPAGSMGPKIEAAVAFLAGGGIEVRVGLPAELPALLRGEVGTLITRGRPR
jgi:carbamate kinase